MLLRRHLTALAIALLPTFSVAAVKAVPVTLTPGDDIQAAVDAHPPGTLYMLQSGTGAIMHIYDPQGRKQAEPLLGDVAWCANAMEAIEGADVSAALRTVPSPADFSTASSWLGPAWAPRTWVPFSDIAWAQHIVT